MTDIDRNTRTLIISFVVAIFGLIPLRFVEVGNMMMPLYESAVLGETYEYVAEPVVTDEVTFVGLEAPYNEIDGPTIISQADEMVYEDYGEDVLGEAVSCVMPSDAQVLVDNIVSVLAEGGLDRGQVDELVSQVMMIESGVCI